MSKLLVALDLSPVVLFECCSLINLLPYIKSFLILLDLLAGKRRELVGESILHLTWRFLLSVPPNSLLLTCPAPFTPFSNFRVSRNF